MRARLLCLALSAVVLGAWMPAEPRALTYVPNDDGPWDPGLMCTGRQDIPFVQNVIEAKWSPDSTRLAVTAGQRTPSTASPVGWKEEEVVYTFDLRSGALSVVGFGIRPEWSTTGTYLSYWPEDEDLRVMKGDKILAKLLMSIPEVRWVGDKLLYIYKRDIREWANGETRTVSRFDKDWEPAYPLDDVYWSADGTRFTLMRYSYDGGVERYIGKTADASLVPLDAPGATHTEWSPTGATLLVRYPNKLEMIGPDGSRESTALATGAIASWTADGRSLLVGRLSSTMPAGDRFEKFSVWGAPQSAEAATLPNLIGARTLQSRRPVLHRPQSRTTGLDAPRALPLRHVVGRGVECPGRSGCAGTARPHRRRRAPLAPSGPRRRGAVPAVLAHRGRHRRTGRLDRRRGG